MTAVKVILIVLAVIMFLMLLAAGSCFYVAYRVKKKAHEFSQEMGANATPYTGKREPCLLSSSEVAAILAQPVEPAEPRGDMACEYRYGRGGNRRHGASEAKRAGRGECQRSADGPRHANPPITISVPDADNGRPGGRPG